MNRLDVEASETLALKAREAQHLWNWVLARQGLAKETKLSSIVEIASASLGLHAARLQSPFVTVLARAVTPSVASGLFARESQAEVATVRCMRKTLHILPFRLASVAHAATLHFRERDALRAIKNAGVSARRIEKTIQNISSLLESNGPTSHRAIESRLKSPQCSIPAIRLSIKLAWEKGYLMYSNKSTGWNREDRHFEVSRIHPNLNFQIDKEVATHQLIETYFDRYGPASVRDAMWWSGLSKSAIIEGLRNIGRRVFALYTPWAESPMYIFEDRFEEFSTERSKRLCQFQHSVNLLAHEDVALKAYFESRGRYMGRYRSGSVFNQIGEVLPSILMDGQVIGLWSWNKKTEEVNWKLFSRQTPSSARQELMRIAKLASAALCTGCAKH